MSHKSWEGSIKERPRLYTSLWTIVPDSASLLNSTEPSRNGGRHVSGSEWMRCSSAADEFSKAEFKWAGPRGLQKSSPPLEPTFTLSVGTVTTFRISDPNQAIEGSRHSTIAEKRLRLDWTKTAQDQKFPGPSKTTTAVQSLVSHNLGNFKTDKRPV